MSDDLVKQLLNAPADPLDIENLCIEAADRIEELEAKLADGDFDVVKTADIAEWREKLNKRFGIGDGRMKSLDVVFVEWSMAEPEWFHEFAHTAIAKIKGEQP